MDFKAQKVGCMDNIVYAQLEQRADKICLPLPEFTFFKCTPPLEKGTTTLPSQFPLNLLSSLQSKLKEEKC